MKRLGILPIIAAAIAAVGMALQEPAAARYYRAVLVAVALLTAVSAYITTSRFTPGDKLFLSWLFVGIGYSLTTIRYSSRLVSMFLGHDILSRTGSDIMLVVQNIAISLALLMFVRAWNATGLNAGRSRVPLIALGIGIALAAGGYPLIQGFQTRSADMVLLISTLGDVVGIALIVPLAMSAFALRGGLLMHTWLYLALCESFWLMYDLWLAVRAPLGVNPAAGVGIEQMIRTAAITFALVATVAQRRAIGATRAAYA